MALSASAPDSSEASGVFNKHEGLALLTTITEDGGSCNPKSPSPSHSRLESNLISKILHLREALDLPSQRAHDSLDQLLLNTLEALTTAYPKCLSGVSGSHPISVQQGLVYLGKVLMSVQDCHAEHKRLCNLGSENHTIIENESLHQVGECVTEMLDQVAPMAKEMFSFMETSKGASAAAAWPEDPPERSLPPLLCRSRSPSRHAGDHQSHSAEAAGAMTQAGQRRTHKEAPRRAADDEGICTSKDGPTCRSDPPSTPEGECSEQTTTACSVSPHPLPAPAPAPAPSALPVPGLPMLLQSWEAMQDANATMAPAPAPAARGADQAASTARRAASVAVGSDGNDGRHSIASMEAGKPSSSASPMASRESTQHALQNVNAGGPNAAPTPPPPPVHNLQEPPPSPTQGPAAPAPPPPPPPGNISAALRSKKAAATKLKRSAQMGSLYRHLRHRVEGSGCARGGKRPNRAAAVPKGDAGQGMADALAEITKRSAYFRQIEEDVETHAATILRLKDAIGSFQPKDMAELARFHRDVERQLACLTDETQVLARFEGFPSRKLETLRTAAALYAKLDAAVATLRGWKLAAPMSQQLDRVEVYFNKIKDDVDVIERNRDEEAKRFQSHSICFDFGVLVRIKEGMVDLSYNCMEMALKESQDARDREACVQSSSQATGLPKMLWRVFQLAFRVYNFAGGQDDRADRLTCILAHEIEAHPL
ncbi:hypothetical protein ACP4OV_001099 [Aristida adscensionis]